MKKFWKWKNRTVTNQADGTPATERTLFLSGTIASESWFDDDVTPQLFKDELNAGEGDIVVWINSPGGDCVAAAQIYNMLMDYKGSVTVKIDGIAASAASVIAMAGTKVLVSPVSMMMIHNPATIAIGDTAEMKKAIEMLDEVKESIMNAYEIKTGLNRTKISHLMDAESWFNAKKAVELGFADEVLFDKGKEENSEEKEEEKQEEVKTVNFEFETLHTSCTISGYKYCSFKEVNDKYHKCKNKKNIFKKCKNTDTHKWSKGKCGECGAWHYNHTPVYYDKIKDGIQGWCTTCGMKWTVVG